MPMAMCCFSGGQRPKRLLVQICNIYDPGLNISGICNHGTQLLPFVDHKSAAIMVVDYKFRPTKSELPSFLFYSLFF